MNRRSADLVLIFVWIFAGHPGVDAGPTTRKPESHGTTKFPLPEPPAGTDPKRHHTVQLQLLREAKIKQNRQWAEGQPCPSGWLHFNDSCYWGSPIPMSWFAAEHECRGFGYDAHLASVHSPAENMRVQAIAGCGASWIGLTKMDPTPTSWAWTDTTENDYSFWRSGHPIGVDERNCAYQDKGSAAANGNGWANGYCTELRVFTCMADAKINGAGEGEGEGEGEAGGEGETGNAEGESTAEAPERLKQHESDKNKPTTPKPKKISKRVGKIQKEEETPPNSESRFPCRGGADWLDGKNGFCYYYSSMKANWYQAEAICRNLSSTLLCIKDDQEQRIAMLGGCDKRTWLGAVKWQPEEKWHWHDDMSYVGNTGAYTNWAQNNTGSNYVISFIDTTGNGAGRWYDTPSANEPMFFICKQSTETEGEGEGEGEGSENGKEGSEGESEGEAGKGEESEKEEGEKEGEKGEAEKEAGKGENEKEAEKGETEKEPAKSETEKTPEKGESAKEPEKATAGEEKKPETGKEAAEAGHNGTTTGEKEPETEQSGGRSERESGNEPIGSETETEGEGTSGTEESESASATGGTEDEKAENGESGAGNSTGNAEENGKNEIASGGQGENGNGTSTSNISENLGISGAEGTNSTSNAGNEGSGGQIGTNGTASGNLESGSGVLGSNSTTDQNNPTVVSQSAPG